MYHRKIKGNGALLYFFIEILSYQRLKNGNVTKVPYLLDVPNVIIDIFF